MKFDVIGMWEMIYKKVIILSVVGLTIWSVNWYLNLTDKSDTFIVSTVYALFLFAIGIYVNYMGNKINESFYDRKDYYLVLSKLNSIFNILNLEDYSDKDVFMAIVHFKTFTSRTDGMKDIPPFVPEEGFRFKYKELDIEDEFIEKRNKLLGKLKENIMDYIDKNLIIKTVPYPNIDSIYFDVRGWCTKNCKIDKNELENIETYIYGLFSESRNEMDELELLMQKITKLYRSYRDKIIWNMKIIENTYGKRLEYEFYKEDQFLNEIRPIRMLVEQVKNSMCTYDELSNDISEFKEDISSLYERIELLEANLTEEIGIAKIELFEKE